MTDLFRDFPGPNAGYVVELYERYLQDPDAVDAATRAYFEQLISAGEVSLEPTAAPTAPAGVEELNLRKISGAANLAHAIREYGHLAAQIDPLGSTPPGEPSLELAFHGLTEEDLRGMPASIVGGPVAERTDNAWQAIQELRRIYSTSIGYDYDHLRIPEEREWLRQAAESGRFRPPQTPINEVALLERLTQVESFEQFLHRTFPGKTRFSIEGLDVMVPMLDEIVRAAVHNDIHAMLIGMAHRGRLNVLAHVLNKPYSQILAEFKDPVHSLKLAIRDDIGWTGDVKYHEGANRCMPGQGEADLDITMAPNPSHLEHVDPVVEGMARAAGTVVSQPGAPTFDYCVSLPVLIHGDGAFPGQGIVAETLNLSRLSGYSTGGTIHIIANNQIGFTTEPSDERSTLYASDLAKGFKIPIVHVNADDPIACIETARLAAAYRHRFGKDFLIDLVGYRRHGHNEGDEPAFTQPTLYARIDKHPSLRELWARRLVSAGLVDENTPEQLVQAQLEHLQEIYSALKPEEQVPEPQTTPAAPGTARRVKTAVKLETLRELNRSLLQLPNGFQLHHRLKRILDRRTTALDAVDEPGVDWALAEQLAFASILADGTAIRMTGEDVERGTFSHRHAVLHDAETGARFVPLQTIPQANSAFEIHNSPLTEAACVGFEYGYNIQAPERLVIWEAQYGDFINTAQAIIDEFVVSGRAKWEQTPSLVMLLPHGYEGQGPDHSGARLERFLQMAAEMNIRVANCTTASQYFHLLRRQALLLDTDPLPLIVMTPKSLLRHKLASSTPRELAEGGWQPVIHDDNALQAAQDVRRLLLCSGKVYVDLVSSELRSQAPWVAIARVEQLYPWPADDIDAALDAFPNLAEVVWMQEEPQNMGAWTHVQPYLLEQCAGRWPVRYCGRPRRASPAEGSAAWHHINQQRIVSQAFAETVLQA